MTKPDTKVYAATITSSNCDSAIGCSWKWVRAFCAAYNVPVWFIGGRRLVPVRALLDAMALLSAHTTIGSGAVQAAEDQALAQEVIKARRKRH